MRAEGRHVAEVVVVHDRVAAEMADKRLHDISRK